MTGAHAPSNAPLTNVAGRRIALFVNSLEMGGVEEHVRQIAHGLNHRGAEVTFVCPEAAQISPLAEGGVAAGAHVVRLTLSHETGILGALRRFIQFTRLLRSLDIEVLHIHLVGYTGGRWALLAAKLARTPAIICTLQIAPEAPERPLVRLERRLANLLVDRFIAVSHITERRLLRYLGQSATKTVMIPNAVELSRYRHLPTDSRERIFPRLGIPVDAIVVGSVARLSPQKGIRYLIEATPAILARMPSVHVLLVGDGSLRAELEQIADELGVRGRVHFAGYRSDIPEWLATMDVFVLPSLFEGLPLSILEAMAAALPVVATAVDGTPEAVQDGVTGRLIPPKDPAAIAAAVVDLMTRPGLAAQMGAAGRARAELYSDTALLDRLTALYVDALSHKGRLRRRPHLRPEVPSNP